MEIGRSDERSTRLVSKRGIKKMRSISGMLQGDPIGISSKLTPEAANAATGPVSGAGAFALTLRNSSNPSDFVSGQRPR